MTDTSDTQRAGTRIADLPLRGLGSEQAERTVAPALRGLPGVVEVQVLAASFRLRVTYDPERTTPAALHAALHDLGVGAAHPSGATPHDSRPA